MRFGHLFAVLATVLALCVPVRGASAHEVPRHVGVRAWVAPRADAIRLLVQIPMDAVRDVDFPVRANDALDAARSLPFLRDAAQLWVADAITLRDGARVLPRPTVVAVRAALPSDRAFDRFGDALTAVQHAPLVDGVDIPHGQLRLEVLLEVPTATQVQDLVLTPAWANLGVRTTTVLTLVNADASERRYTFEGNPGDVRLDPRWWHAASRFVREGMHHLLFGYDHLLFLLCLVLPFRRIRPLIAIVTAFTVAHSVTLIASALGFVPDVAWFGPFVETVIAASIVGMAVGNLLVAQPTRRWVWAFGFGLVHGFGFSAALGDSLQFAGAHLLTSLLAFNVGLEVAQVGLLLVLVPVLNRAFARVPARTAIIVASAFVAHEAWHWTSERWALFRTYPLVWPAFDVSAAVVVLRVSMAMLVLVALVWMLRAFIARVGGEATVPQPGKAEPVLRAPHTMGASAVVLLTVSTLALSLAGALAVPLRALPAQTRSTMSGVYTADQATKGREVFTSNCLGCHTTASHQGPAFQLKWFGRSLYDLYDYVSQAMPKAAPGSLTEDEYVWVTAYILRLNGMPAGRTELSAEPSLLKAVRVDSSGRAVGGSPESHRSMSFRTSPVFRSHDSRLRARTENP